MTRRTRSASRQPGPSRKRPRRLAPEPSVVEIIELTSDSDNDLPTSKTPATAPNFGRPDSQLLADAPPAAGPSQQAARGDDLPLFLPEGDNAQHVIRPPPPAPQPRAPADPLDEYIVRVLEIVPDVEPAHALALIEQFMRSQQKNVVELVLHALFENPSYPKVNRKGKNKLVEPEDDPNPRASPKPKIDYTSKDRVYDCGPHYFECSLEQLMTDFPRIPKPYIRARLFDNRFYASTYLVLVEDLKKQPLPFKLKLTKSVVSKGKARQDPELDKEREWVLLRVAELAAERDAALAASINEQKYEDNGEGIECGCCFSAYPFDQMIQCPEAHLFCKSCMTSYASNLLGEHNPNIVCMDQSGCKLPFPESELGRFLSSKLLELFYRVKQRKEIEAAGLENLEECPFCEYKCVIENETEKLFRCENAGCLAVTCRMCKKPDHLPKTCKEADEDKQLDAQHIIEEAMTQALMRNCPKCQKSFIKEMGCNKMTCPNCHTVSCYICRKVINGYEHFSNPPPNSGKLDKSKCILWDPVEQRHAEEVSEAAKRALAELRKSRPDVDESNLKVDIPVPPAVQRPGVVPPPQQAFGLHPHPHHGHPRGGVAMPGLPPHAMVQMRLAGMGMGMGPGGGMGVRGPGMGPGAGMGMGPGIPGMGMGPGVHVPMVAAIPAPIAVPAPMGMRAPVGVRAPVGMPAPGIGAPMAMVPGMVAGAGGRFTFGAGQAHRFVPPAQGAPHGYMRMHPPGP